MRPSTPFHFLQCNLSTLPFHLLLAVSLQHSLFICSSNSGAPTGSTTHYPLHPHWAVDYCSPCRQGGQRRAGYVTPLVRGDSPPTASEAATVGACPASRSLIPHVWTLDHCIPLSTRSRLGFAEGQRAVAVACQDSVLCHGYIVTLQHPTPQPSVKTFVLCA